MKKLAKYFFYLSIIFTNGCVVLTYEFEAALNNLPEGYKLIKITNYHIDYSLGGMTYRAYYDNVGTIYKTKQTGESIKEKYEPRYF